MLKITSKSSVANLGSPVEQIFIHRMIEDSVSNYAARAIGRSLDALSRINTQVISNGQKEALSGIVAISPVARAHAPLREEREHPSPGVADELSVSCRGSVSGTSPISEDVSLAFPTTGSKRHVDSRSPTSNL